MGKYHDLYQLLDSLRDEILKLVDEDTDEVSETKMEEFLQTLSKDDHWGLKKVKECISDLDMMLFDL